MGHVGRTSVLAIVLECDPYGISGRRWRHEGMADGQDDVRVPGGPEFCDFEFRAVYDWSGAQLQGIIRDQYMVPASDDARGNHSVDSP